MLLTVVHDEVVESIQMFSTIGLMPAIWKPTFIALLPKRQNTLESDHFRPLSLCITLYKICTKIFVDRMKPILPRLISLEQDAFIKWHSISDNMLIMQEFIHALLKAFDCRCLLAIKLDMEHAYDQVSWGFLYQALKSLGFHRHWIS